MTLKQLQNALLKSYSEETAYPDWQNKWNKRKPTIGQCAITALLVQFYFGGEIYKHNIEDHYFNFINGEVIDLTKEQFDYRLDYSNSQLKQPDLTKANTLERFELLKNRVENYLNNK